MRYYHNGTGFTVQCTRRDVETFKRTYPCSGLPDIPIAFVFWGQDDELEDILCRRDTGSFDGPALVALMEDARTYGQSKARERKE